MNKIAKAFVCVALATALVAGLAACSSAPASGSSAESAAPASSAAASTEAAGSASAEGGLTEVTFVSPTALQSYDYLAIYAADYLGYFKEEGIKVKYVEQLGADDVKMVASGTAQFAYPSPGVYNSCIDAGITNVKAIMNYDSVQIFGVALNKSAGIKDWADLKGKDVALYNEAWSSLMSPLLDKAGMKLEDVNMVSYGDGRYEAVKSGKAPAMATWLSEYYQLVGQGYDLDYLDGNKICPQVSNSLVTSDELIQSNPDLVKKFVRAMTKAMYFCYLNPDAAADITLLTCPNLQIDWKGAQGATKGDVMQIFGTSEEEQKKTIEAGIGLFDMTKAQNAADNLLKAGAISTAIDTSKYYSNDFVDTSWDKAKVEADAKAYTCTSPQYTKDGATAASPSVSASAS